jgi:hypothetical protein
MQDTHTPLAQQATVALFLLQESALNVPCRHALLLQWLTNRLSHQLRSSASSSPASSSASLRSLWRVALALLEHSALPATLSLPPFLLRALAASVTAASQHSPTGCSDLAVELAVLQALCARVDVAFHPSSEQLSQLLATLLDALLQLPSEDYADAHDHTSTPAEQSMLDATGAQHTVECGEFSASLRAQLLGMTSSTLAVLANTLAQSASLRRPFLSVATQLLGKLLAVRHRFSALATHVEAVLRGSLFEFSLLAGYTSAFTSFEILLPDSESAEPSSAQSTGKKKATKTSSRYWLRFLSFRVSLCWLSRNERERERERERESEGARESECA